MIGQTISHYKIIEKLGEGGMGVVYKAQDTKLDRFVALKFLPPHLAASEQDKARFIQEAKSAAALNHPNVCSIIDIQEHDGPQGDKQMFIVMEFIDGQTLLEKKSSISQKQAIDYAIQIAEGLAAAHEKGIVHRDIKPENIMIRKDGIVQIMDFGLAKLVGISRLTKQGSTVGTLGYMSPEQVQGQETDHRSDIFSFGVLFYEMLTGRSPFNGAHESAILYEIVNVDVPPMSTIKPEIDAELDRIVLECMEKDPNERMQSIKQVAIDLNRFKRTSSRTRLSRTFAASPVSKISGETAGQPVSAKTSVQSIFHNSRTPWTIAAAAFLCGLLSLIFSLSKKAEGDRTVIRLNISAITSPGQQILRSDIPDIAISPDGRYVAYTLTESGSTQLYLRSLSSFQTLPVKGTENGSAPFFSPDGQWLGFAADGKIKKIPTAGGSVETICAASGFRGASWGPDNRIIFSPDFASGLMSVSASGGDMHQFSTLDSVRNERSHRWPQILPGGKWVLYTVGDQNSPNSYTDAALVFQSLENGDRHVLDVRGEMARYIQPGYLVVARNGVLLAAPFSLKDFRATQQFSTVVNDVSGDPGSGISHFSVSDNGHLVYLSGSLNRDLELVWVNREGKVTPLPLPAQPYNTPRVSPDGSSIAVTIGLVTGSDNDIWIYDIKTSALNRFTFDKAMFDPLWSLDSKKIYFASAVAGKEGLMVKPADGSSAATMLHTNKLPQFPVSLSPSGSQIIINTLGGTTEGDIYLMDLNAGKEPLPLISSPIYEYGGHISSDGRYIIYGSIESGRFEVYVCTYPDLKGKWQVSTGGGNDPMWSPDGKEIFYVSTVGKMIDVPVKTTPKLSVGQPRELFDVSQMNFPNNPISNFDITPDGERFIMIRSAHFNPSITSFNIVLHWTEDLQRQMQSGN